MSSAMEYYNVYDNGVGLAVEMVSPEAATDLALNREDCKKMYEQFKSFSMN